MHAVLSVRLAVEASSTQRGGLTASCCQIVPFNFSQQQKAGDYFVHFSHQKLDTVKWMYKFSISKLSDSKPIEMR